MGKGPGDDSPLLGVGFAAFHRVSLASACLPISKDGAVVSLQNTLDDGQRRHSKDGLLLAGGVEGHIKGENFVLLARGLDVPDDDLPLLGVDLNDVLVLLFVLVVGQGATPERHLDALGGGWRLSLVHYSRMEIIIQLRLNLNTSPLNHSHPDSSQHRPTKDLKLYVHQGFRFYIHFRNTQNSVK